MGVLRLYLISFVHNEDRELARSFAGLGVQVNLEEMFNAVFCRCRGPKLQSWGRIYVC
jgi:hypothetical protein